MIEFDDIEVEFVREVGVLEVPLAHLPPEAIGELQARFDFAEAEYGGVWAEFACGMEWRDGGPVLLISCHDQGVYNIGQLLMGDATTAPQPDVGEA